VHWKKLSKKMKWIKIQKLTEDVWERRRSFTKSTVKRFQANGKEENLQYSIHSDPFTHFSAFMNKNA
jgi:hypothetical protein